MATSIHADTPGPPEGLRELASKVRRLPQVAQVGLVKTESGQWGLKVWLRWEPVPDLAKYNPGYPVVYEGEPLGVHHTDVRQKVRTWFDVIATLVTRERLQRYMFVAVSALTSLLLLSLLWYEFLYPEQFVDTLKNAARRGGESGTPRLGAPSQCAVPR